MALKGQSIPESSQPKTQLLDAKAYHTDLETHETTYKHSDIHAKFSDAETPTSIGAVILSAEAKTTPIDADMVPVMDTADSNKMRKMSWENVKATLKAYFDGLYVDDIVVTAPADGQLLVRDQTAGYWENTANVTLDDATTTLATNTNDLTIACGTDKTVVLDSGVWNDIQTSAANMRTGGTAMTFDILSGVGATANYQYRFDTLDEVYCTVQFPHGMKVNSVIHPHLHIINRTALTGVASTVYFTMYYAWVDINTNAAATAGVIDYASVAGNKNLQNLGQFYHGIVDFGTITPGAGQGNISSMLLVKLVRNNAGTNVYSGNEIFTLGFDVHYEIDTIGSRQEFIK